MSSCLTRLVLLMHFYKTNKHLNTPLLLHIVKCHCSPVMKSKRVQCSLFSEHAVCITPFNKGDKGSLFVKTTCRLPSCQSRVYWCRSTARVGLCEWGPFLSSRGIQGKPQPFTVWDHSLSRLLRSLYYISVPGCPIQSCSALIGVLWYDNVIRWSINFPTQKPRSCRVLGVENWAMKQSIYCSVFIVL